MTVVDFIDIIDDIIDLSSDEETVEQDHNATQPQAMLLDEQAVFVLAGKERQDEQAAFVSAGEGSQEAAESENALVDTESPSVMEKMSFDSAERENCPSTPTSAPLHSSASITPKPMTSEVGDTQLVATASPSVMEKAPVGTAETKSCPSSQASPLPRKFFYILCLAATTPKAQTSEAGGTKLMKVRHPKKKYHTSTPRRSPRFCGNSVVEELGADHKRSRMLDPAEESTWAAADNAASTVRTDSAN